MTKCRGCGNDFKGHSQDSKGANCEFCGTKNFKTDSCTIVEHILNDDGTACECEYLVSRKLLEAEIRISELKWADDKFDSLLQATEDGDRVHPGEYFEAIEARIKELESGTADTPGLASDKPSVRKETKFGKGKPTA